MLRVRSCSSAQANSRRTVSRMWRNDVPSSARRRLIVRRLTASARATISGVTVASPRFFTRICRTRPLSGPLTIVLALGQHFVETTADDRRNASSAPNMGRAASAALRIIEVEPAAKRTAA